MGPGACQSDAGLSEHCRRWARADCGPCRASTSATSARRVLGEAAPAGGYETVGRAEQDQSIRPARGGSWRCCLRWPSRAGRTQVARHFLRQKLRISSSSRGWHTRPPSAMHTARENGHMREMRPSPFAPAARPRAAVGATPPQPLPPPVAPLDAGHSHRTQGLLVGRRVSRRPPRRRGRGDSTGLEERCDGRCICVWTPRGGHTWTYITYLPQHISLPFRHRFPFSLLLPLSLLSPAAARPRPSRTRPSRMPCRPAAALAQCRPLR